MRKICMFSTATIVILGVAFTATAKDAKFPEDWKSFDVGRLVKLVESLPGSSSEALAKIAPVFYERLLANPSESTALDYERWVYTVWPLGGSLAAVECAHWRNKFRAAFVQYDLEAKELVYLGSAIRYLDDDDFRHFLAESLAKTSEWQNAGVFEISRIRTMIRIPMGYESGSVAARIKLFSVFVRWYLTNNSNEIQSELCQAWRSFGRETSKALSAEHRAEWRQRLRSEYDQRKNLRLADMVRLEHVLQLLRDKEASAFLANLMERASDWETASVQDLANMAESLSGGTQTSPTVAARAKLAAAVLTKHLTEASRIRSVGVDAIARLARALSKHISPEDRLKWAKNLRSSLAKKELGAKELMLLSEALRCLADEDGSLWAAQRIVSGNALESASIDELIELAQEYAGEKDATSWSIRRKLSSVILNTLMTESSKIVLIDAGYWAKLARSLETDLSDEECVQWRTRLWEAFARRKLDLRELLWLTAAMRALRDRDEFSFMAMWLEKNDSWRSWNWKLTHYASYLSKVAYTSKPKGIIARKRLFENVFSTYLSDGATIRSIGCVLWRHVAQQFQRELARPQGGREEWVRRLRDAFVPSPEAIWAMDPLELMSLADLLAMLKDKKASKLVSTYIYGSDRWQSLDIETLMDLSRRTIVNVPDEEVKVARLRLAEHIGRGYLLNREVALFAGRLPTFAAYFAGDMTLEARNCWAAKFWGAFAGSRAALRELEEGALDDLLTCLRSLDATDLAAMIERQRQYLRCSPEATEKTEVDGWWSDSAWPLLCWRVIAVRPSRRQAVWKEGIRELLSESVLPTNEVLKASERLVAVLLAEKTGSLSPVQILADTLDACRDYSTGEAVRKRLNKYKLLMYLDEMPSQFQEIMERVRELEEAGQIGKACKVCTELIAEAEKAGHKEFTALIRLKLLELTLEQRTVDVASAEKQLQAIKSTSTVPGEEVWNLECRLLIDRLAMAPPERRETVWNEGIPAISGEDFCIFEDTFADLDEFGTSLGNALLVDRVLNDLLLLTPNISSMHRIQLRRVKALAIRGDWENTRFAALLAVLFANGTSSGPFEAVKDCIEIMESAGAPSDALEWIRICLGRSASGGYTKEKPATKPCAVEPVDQSLKSAARQLLQTKAIGISSRQKAFCQLFAGSAEDAMVTAHAALAESQNTRNRIGDRLNDISTILSVADGHIRNSDRFSRWLVAHHAKAQDASMNEIPLTDALLGILIKCQKGLRDVNDPNKVSTKIATYAKLSTKSGREISERWLKRREKNLVRWGIEALEDQNRSWPQYFWARAIHTRGNLEGVAQAILFRAGRESQIENIVELLTATSLLLSSAQDRQYLLHRAAEVLFGTSDFEGCLKLLERADTLVKGSRKPQEMSVGFVRVMSLIGLKRYDEAIKALAEMELLPGTAEEHARTIYLTGWIYLKQNNQSKALSVLRRGIETYPNASFTLKAREIVMRFKGT